MPRLVLPAIIRFVGMPRFVQMLFGRIQLDFNRFVHGKRITQLLIVHAQGSRESHLEVLVAGAALRKHIVIDFSSLEDRIFKLAPAEA